MQFPDLTADSSVDAIGDGNKKKRNKQKRAPQADDLDMWVDDGVGQEAPILEYKDGVLVGSEIQQDEEGQSEGSDEEEEEDEESEEEGDVDDEEESGSDDDEEESTDESDVEEELLDKNNTESSKQSTDALEKLRNCGFIASSDEEEGEEDDNDTITNVPVPKTGSKTKATSATAESSKSLSKKKSSSESPSSTSTSSLPFVFPAPNNYSDLLVLIKDRNAQDCDTIFQRLRTLYNVSLSSENKDKLKVRMEDFKPVLSIHIAHIKPVYHSVPLSFSLIPIFHRHC